MLFSDKNISKFKSLQHLAARYSYSTAWIMVVASLAMTAWLWYIIKEENRQNASIRFEFRVQEILSSIKKRMTAYEQILLGGSGLFSASREVTRKEWKTYVDKLKIEQNYPGILGIGHSKVISPKEKNKFVKSIRKEGFPDFKIWPEDERDFYTTIIFLEPFKDRNLRAFGYDMFTDPVRREAMAKARDEGITALSGKVTLVQETDDDIQAGFLMYVPLYEEGISLNTVQDRQKALKGYVYSPFRINDLMEGILGDQLHHLDVLIYDGKSETEDAKLFNGFIEDPVSQTTDDFKLEKKLKINEHWWTLHFNSLPAFSETIDTEKPLIVLIAGSVITVLFFTVAMSLITTRKLHRKTEQILESTGEGIFGIDLKGHCTFVNKTAVEMLGFDPVQSNKKIHNLIHHSHSNSAPYPVKECPIYNAIKTRIGCIRDDEVFWKADGTSFPVQYSSYPIIENGEVRGGVVSFTNITERKKSERIIDESLKEKDVLLREIHHRVKNNMQIISSLLNLQSSYLQDPQAIDVFRESQNRIRSMALIHEKLYRSGNIAGIKLGEYINDLINHLKNSYSYNSERITLHSQIDDIILNIDTAISLGLIINELLSNAFKYAFPDENTGEIKIIFQSQNSNGSTLTIIDNGIGFPGNINFRETESLGLQLVITLVNQLEGTIELSTNGGTQFSINLPGLT